MTSTGRDASFSESLVASILADKVIWVKSDDSKARTGACAEVWRMHETESPTLRKLSHLISCAKCSVLLVSLHKSRPCPFCAGPVVYIGER